MVLFLASFKDILLLNDIYVFVCMWVCAFECKCLWGPEKDFGSPKPGVTSCCEPLSMGADNSDPVQEQLTLSTAEKSLQPHLCFCLFGWLVGF